MHEDDWFLEGEGSECFETWVAEVVPQQDVFEVVPQKDVFEVVPQKDVLEEGVAFCKSDQVLLF